MRPRSVAFEEAAGIPLAASTALQALRDHGKVRPGQRVLIVGASGGVGTYAVQLAKFLGATVTGVSSTKNLELLASLVDQGTLRTHVDRSYTVDEVCEALTHVETGHARGKVAITVRSM
jgi:NADPH:quinone reductase-like Zn-dependent oxidoreductase